MGSSLSSIFDPETILPRRSIRSIWSRVLRVPLLGKLLGANLVLVVAVLAGHIASPGAPMEVQLSVTLLLSFILTTLLVWLALRPVAELEATAQRVSAGDFGARAPESPLADRDIAALASTLNRLLDRVEADRARIQYLAGRSVRARDIERETLARELRESFSQTLSGVSMHLAAIGLAAPPEVAAAIATSGEPLRDLTEEMRSVAETLYPGTLGEFGLRNALDALARRVNRRSGVQVRVDSDPIEARLSSRAASALFRVADEALRNAEQHGMAEHVRVVLRSNGPVVLEIEDDGHGMNMRDMDPLQAGLGLFSARAVLALCGGELHISSEPQRGTRVVATVPAQTTGES